MVISHKPRQFKQACNGQLQRRRNRFSCKQLARDFNGVAPAFNSGSNKKNPHESALQ